MIGFLLNSDMDLEVESGTLQLGNVDEQIAEGIIIANPGDFRETPRLGKSIYMMLNGIADEFWKNDLKDQLKTQKIQLKGISINETEITIDL